MSDIVKELEIGGRTWRIQGDDQDQYFARAEEHARPINTNLLTIAARRIQPSSTILDIGANIGLATLGLSALVPEGRVIAFEPSPETTRHLTANVAANDLRNVTVVSAAVGSRAGTVSFAQHPAFSAGNSVVHDTSPHRAATVDVPAVALDEWLEEAGISRIDFVKLDIEGYEPWALHGARRTLVRDRPPIFMEFNSWTLLAYGDVNPVAFAKCLCQAYRVMRLVPGGGESEVINPVAFAHANLTRHGCVEDILMELREPFQAPRLEQMIGAH